MIGPEGHETFAAIVAPGRRFVLVTHINPDGDAIGSEVGLGRYLLHLGSRFRIVNQDATPESFRFLEDETTVAEAYAPDAHDAVLDEADVIVLLDNSAPDRLGRLEAPLRERAAKTFCIDHHHPARGLPWARSVIDVRASATGAIVYELVMARGWRPDARAAQALFTALATDTGFFRFGSATPEVHRVAAELLDAGAHTARAFAEVYERNPPSYTRLLGRALAGLRLDHEGRVGSVRLDRETVAACGAESVDTSEITTPILATDGVRVAILFREMPDGRTKVSLRSKGEIDVHRLAVEFGGGGHRNASGIVLDDRLDEVAARVVSRSGDLLKTDG